MSIDILPDSRPERPKGAKQINATWWMPIYCANCGHDGGLVPEDNMTFAFYLCQSCADTWGPIAHTYMEPDAVFWRRVAEDRKDQSPC